MDRANLELDVNHDGVCHVVRTFRKWINMFRWEHAVLCDTLDAPHLEELRKVLETHKTLKRGQALREYQLLHRLGGLLVVTSDNEEDQVELPTGIDVPFEPIEFKRDRERAAAIAESLVGQVDAQPPYSPNTRNVRRDRQQALHLVFGIVGTAAALIAFFGLATDVFFQTTTFTREKLLWLLAIGTVILGLILYYLSENRWMLERAGVVHTWQFVLGVKRKTTFFRPPDCPILAEFKPSPPGWNIIFWTDRRIQPSKYGSDEIEPDIVAASDEELQLLVAVWRSALGVRDSV